MLRIKYKPIKKILTRLALILLLILLSIVNLEEGDFGRGDLNFLVLGCNVFSGDFDSAKEQYSHVRKQRNPRKFNYLRLDGCICLLVCSAKDLDLLITLEPVS